MKYDGWCMMVPSFPEPLEFLEQTSFYRIPAMLQTGDYPTRFIGDGSESDPGQSFASQTGTGVYRDSMDANPGYVISTNGHKRLKVSDTKIETFVPFEIPEIDVDRIFVDNGTVNEPSYSFKSNTSTGFFSTGSEIGVSADGVLVGAFNSGGLQCPGTVDGQTAVTTQGPLLGDHVLTWS